MNQRGRFLSMLLAFMMGILVVLSSPSTAIADDWNGAMVWYSQSAAGSGFEKKINQTVDLPRYGSVGQFFSGASDLETGESNPSSFTFTRISLTKATEVTLRFNVTLEDGRQPASGDALVLYGNLGQLSFDSYSFTAELWKESLSISWANDAAERTQTFYLNKGTYYVGVRSGTNGQRGHLNVMGMNYHEYDESYPELQEGRYNTRETAQPLSLGDQVTGFLCGAENYGYTFSEGDWYSFYLGEPTEVSITSSNPAEVRDMDNNTVAFGSGSSPSVGWTGTQVGMLPAGKYFILLRSYGNRLGGYSLSIKKNIKHQVYIDEQNGKGYSYYINDGETLPKPDVPVRPGYTFAGWQVDGQAYDFSTPVTRDFTLVAQWVFTPEHTARVGEGSIYLSFTVNTPDADITWHLDDEAIGRLGSKRTEGSSFNGGGYTKSTVEFIPLKEGITTVRIYNGVNEADVRVIQVLPAYVKHLVTFEGDVGGQVEPQRVIDGERVQRPIDPFLPGRVFKGWYADPGLTKPYDFDNPVTSDITLYAKWEITHYTVTYETNGGTKIPSSSFTYGESVPRPKDPSKEGYVFGGWFADEGFTKAFNFDDDAIGSDVTLYAKWIKKPRVYTVAFESNGGTRIDPMKLEEGEAVDKPEDPVRDGYVFDGWYEDAELKAPYRFGSPVEGDLTLYAKWDRLLKVVFEPNGGTAVPVQQLRRGETVTKPENPSRGGFTFAGWFSDSALKNPFDFKKPIARDLTLYAKWESSVPSVYTVQFKSNGGVLYRRPKNIWGVICTEAHRPDALWLRVQGLVH